jgi:hypothetical protein
MYINVEARTLKVHLVRGHTSFAAATETLQAVLHYFAKTNVRIVGIEYHDTENHYFRHNYLIYCDYYLVREEEAAEIRAAMMHTDTPEEEIYARNIEARD